MGAFRLVIISDRLSDRIENSRAVAIQQLFLITGWTEDDIIQLLVMSNGVIAIRIICWNCYCDV